MATTKSGEAGGRSAPRVRTAANFLLLVAGEALIFVMLCWLERLGWVFFP